MPSSPGMRASAIAGSNSSTAPRFGIVGKDVTLELRVLDTANGAEPVVLMCAVTAIPSPM